MAHYPTRFQLRTLWNAATGVSILILGALLVGLVWLMGQIFGFLQPVLVPLAVSAIIAYLLDPVVRIFQKRGFSRRWAVVSTFAGFTLLAAGLVAIMIPLVGGQIHNFQQQRQAIADKHPPAATSPTPTDAKPIDEMMVDILIGTRNRNEWAKPFIDPLLGPPSDPNSEAPKATLTAALDEAAELGRIQPDPPIVLQSTELWAQGKTYLDEILGWVKGGAGKILGFLGLAIGFIMVPIYLYYFLSESAAIKEHWHEYVPLKASRFKTELIETLTEINRYLISFFRGQVLVAFIDGILVGLALTAFNLPLGLLIGILMALLGIIPYIGNIITLVPACVLAYFHFSVPGNQHVLGDNPWAYVGGVVAIFVIVQQINSLLTAPKIVGDSVGLHPMTVIFSMLFWSLILGGFVGALLAVPLTAAVKVLFRRYIWDRRMRDGYIDADQTEFPGEEWLPSDPAP
ncbi:MAG: AI-2E family transporter [Verrucomicrobia bacterium]|nr:MAG: AI-2E family transporter [Verrucomicrobiota bacterium]TAF26071.1 MAG: AI-2E family transporter [Verrucomicrobiota bacterium]TAF41003.1 MAG: AI-2E family transporter [Verrucomicrobiota bacterium]